MLEASSRVVQLFLAEMRLGQQNIEQLTSGLSLGLQTPTTQLVNWNDCATLFDRSAEAAGGNARVADLYESVFVRALPEAHALTQLAPDAASGSWLINGFIDSAFFINVRYRMTRISERELHLKVRMPNRRGQRDSPAFFHAMAGNLRASSGFFGMPPSTVRAHIRPFAADYELSLPALGPARVRSSPPFAERRVRAAFLRNCQAGLNGVRRAFEELHRSELRGLESEAFSRLSAAVSRALLSRERSVMPEAAVRAIAEELRCSRVAIKLLGPSAKRPALLAAFGPPKRGLLTLETAAAAGLLLLQADIAKGSPEAAALERLAPWLALLFGHDPNASASPVHLGDWADQRLAQLAQRWNLTPRQQQVAWLMAQGETNKSIAQLLACAEGTVELHAHAVLFKSRLPNRSALAAHFYNGK